MGGKNPQEGRKDQLNLYIQPRCICIVAFVFLIEPGNVAGLIGDIIQLFIYLNLRIYYNKWHRDKRKRGNK